MANRTYYELMVRSLAHDWLGSEGQRVAEDDKVYFVSFQHWLIANGRRKYLDELSAMGLSSAAREWFEEELRLTSGIAFSTFGPSRE